MSLKVPARHGLSKWIGKLVRSMNMRNTQFTSSNFISNEMEVNGNALHTRMEHGVGANISGTYIVTIDDWSGWDWNFQLLKKIHDRLPTLLRRRGFIGPSVCAFCHSDSESLDHLLLDCQFIRDIWHHITNAFLISLDFSAGFHHLVIQAMDLSFSSQVSVLWPTAFMTCGPYGIFAIDVSLMTGIFPVTTFYPSSGRQLRRSAFSVLVLWIIHRLIFFVSMLLAFQVFPV